MLKAWLSKATALFFILGFVFIPLTFYGWDGQYLLSRWLFARPIGFMQNHFFAGAIKALDLSSDTIGLNLLLCFLLMMAFAVVFLIEIFKVKSTKLVGFCKSVSVYYLAAVLLKYGFDKIFKLQFYLPEPNILYSRFGDMHKDILFWSTMGLSHTYSVVTGCVEVLAALLILYGRTRVFGFCLAVVVLLNVLLTNISFDISVKTFTTFLLAVAAFNLYPYLKSIYSFFVLRKQSQLEIVKPTSRAKWVNAVLSIALVVYALFPYLASGNFNDDHSPRPFLHGAYTITHFKAGADTLKPVNFPYKRFFIHRNNYLIFEQQDDSMRDYHFMLDEIKKQLVLEDYQNHKITVNYNYIEQTGRLELKFDNYAQWVVDGKVLDWRALPALQDEVHGTVDGER